MYYNVVYRGCRFANDNYDRWWRRVYHFESNNSVGTLYLLDCVRYHDNRTNHCVSLLCNCVLWHTRQSCHDGQHPSRTQTTYTDICCHQIPWFDRFFFSYYMYLYFFNFTNLVAIVKSFAICFYAFYVNSSFHVVLLSTIRYFITIYPLKSRQHLTLNTISLTSL